MTDVMIRSLTKSFGPVVAVDDLSFTARAGAVTGFLGPNGSGKTTTMRMLLGLVRPSSGQALLGGRRYLELPRPRREVGAVLDVEGFHPGRTGQAQLRILARSNDIPVCRVDEVLGQVGLEAAGGRRVGGYSLGMRQRLGLAGALLGDPGVLVLDEPANGLDPEGVVWLRTLIRGLAAQGRAVLVSSHLLAEVAQSADEVVVISDGRLRFAGPLASLGADSQTLEAGFLRLTAATNADSNAGSNA
jgi:ABC-2 type transport system ATP-binding protein